MHFVPFLMIYFQMIFYKTSTYKESFDFDRKVLHCTTTNEWNILYNRNVFICCYSLVYEPILIFGSGNV